MKVQNTGSATTYLPGERGTIVVKAGATVDVTLGEADYGRRTTAGIVIAEGIPTDVEDAAMREARTAEQAGPLAAFYAKHPQARRYAVAGWGAAGVPVVQQRSPAAG